MLVTSTSVKRHDFWSNHEQFIPEVTVTGSNPGTVIFLFFSSPFFYPSPHSFCCCCCWRGASPLPLIFLFIFLFLSFFYFPSSSSSLFNPQHACVRVTVASLSICLSVCVSTSDFEDPVVFKFEMGTNMNNAKI